MSHLQAGGGCPCEPLGFFLDGFVYLPHFYLFSCLFTLGVHFTRWVSQIFR